MKLPSIHGFFTPPPPAPPHTHIHCNTQTTSVVEITNITQDRVTQNETVISCEAVGYPDLFIELLNSSGDVITANTEEFMSPGTYETAFTRTLTVSYDGQCPGPFYCSASNSQDRNSRIVKTKRIDVCPEGKFPVACAFEFNNCVVVVDNCRY